jgi:hypothetical protein
MSVLDGKEIVEESGADMDYTLRFEGTCKWSVDSYCHPWEGDFPVILPDDADEAMNEADNKYRYHTVQERSKMFEVEVLCNSADIDVGIYEEFEHYSNGVSVPGECPEECPEELSILEEPEEGCCRCCVCGAELPQDECVTIDDGDTWFCQDCHGEIFGDCD